MVASTFCWSGSKNIFLSFLNVILFKAVRTIFNFDKKKITNLKSFKAQITEFLP